MGEFSLWHWLIVILIVLLVFGVKRLPEMGASLGKGIREFKKSLSDIGNDTQDRTTLPPAADRQAPVNEDREPKRLSR
jgi:sec-independent protein translocase protein TatA